MRSAYNASKFSILLVCAASLTLGLISVRAGSLQTPAQVTAYVTVTDKGGKPLAGLTADDFKVLVGDAETKVDAVKPATDPVSLAVILAVDQKEMPLVQDALSTITKGLRQIPGSREALTRWEDNKVPFEDVGPKTDPLLTTFNKKFPSPVQVILGVMGSASDLGTEQTMRRDILVIAQVELEGTAPPTQPQASGTVDLLHKNKAELWMMTINSSQDTGAPGNDFLMQVAKRSGGGVTELLKNAMLSPTAKDILSRIAGQYAVTYDVSSSSNALRVTVNKPGAVVIAPTWVY